MEDLRQSIRLSCLEQAHRTLLPTAHVEAHCRGDLLQLSQAVL